ncbi:MAG TPA: sulfotransferase domain-containing protein [Candidatus Binatia bacterium]|jgi:hypothetical protein
MVKVWRRNWTSEARRYASADAIVVSIPKSGRTWFRVFLHAYFCALEKREFTLRARELFKGNVPRFLFTHDLWAHLTGPRVGDRITGRQLIPAPAIRQKRILLLSRDPRDVVVSLFFQHSRRTRRYGGDLHEMIHHSRFRISRMVDIMNTWMVEWGGGGNFKLIRYEDCRRYPEAVFRELLTFFGCREIDAGPFAHAVEFSRFENMRAMEAAGKAKKKTLLPGDAADPDSYKVRRGRVGGFKDYLSPEDVAYLERALERLDERYGYGRKSGSSSAGVDPANSSPAKAGGAAERLID